MRIGITSVGVIAPGLAGWPAARDILRGAAGYEPAPLPKIVPAWLPARERRRATRSISLALGAAEETMATPERARSVPAVFACSGGDTDVIDTLCCTLLAPERPVSPAQFHNSVHNAPAGYWSIAIGDLAATVSLSAYDASFGAGLLEALGLLADGAKAALLVAYDVPPPPAIWPFRPLHAPFAVGLALSADPAAGASLDFRLERGRPEDTMDDPGLERLRAGNPAARALPLLHALALERPGEVVLPYLPGQALCLEHAPA